MSRSRVACAACVLALVGAFAPTSGGARQRQGGVRPSLRAKITLRAMGRPHGVVFVGGTRRWSSTPRMWFNLPSGTREQRSNWYVLHLHYKVVLARPYLPGRETIIGAATNKVGCALIRFKAVSPSTLDVAEDGTLHGVNHRTVRTTVVSGWFENYLAGAGVHGGRNPLDLIVSQHEGRVVQSVTFYADSFIAHTNMGPSILRFRGLPRSIVLRRGHHDRAECDRAKRWWNA